jgi:hypothetical protein
MKLKPVVASLVVLGLMAPALAHKPMKSVVAQQAVVDQNSVISTVCSDSWFNRITIGGMGSVVGIAGNRDLPGSFANTGNSSDLYINNVNLLANVNLSNWSKFTLNLAYLGAPDQWRMTSSSSADLTGNSGSHRIFADEAYVTFSDLAKHPLYVKIGKAYVPFGEYNDQYVPWQIESPAQMLAQTNGPTAIVGLATDFGLYASAFALKGSTQPINSTTNNIRNWGGKIGYQDNLANFNAPNARVNFNLSYIRNVWDSLAFTPDTALPQSTLSSSTTARDPVGALSAHVDMSYKAFSAYADWVGTLTNMHETYTNATSTASSKFWGANVNAAYAFETMSHDSSLGAGIQFSGNGEWFGESSVGKISPSAGTGGLFSMVIPKWRAVAEYKVNLYKNTDLGVVYAHSKSYDISSADRTSNTGLACLTVKF